MRGVCVDGTEDKWLPVGLQCPGYLTAVWDLAATAAAAMEKHSISISGSNTWMATVTLAADKATLDVSWTNYFTECKSKGRAYFKGKIQTGGQGRGTGGQLPPPAGAAYALA